MLGIPKIASGIYPGAGQAALLRSNDQQWLMQSQLFNVGGSTNVNTTAGGGNPFASIAVELEKIRARSYPNGVALHCYFTNAAGVATSPGSFEIDLQTSDIDSDANFCTLSGSTLTALNPSQVGRIENSTLWAKYIRAYVKTITTATYLSNLATR